MVDHGVADDVDYIVCTHSDNDPELTERFLQVMEKVLPGCLEEMPLRKSAEDFAWFLTKKPGFIFRFGTRNEALGCVGVSRCNDFKIDEQGMEHAIEAFV